MKEKDGSEWQLMADWIEGKACRKWMLGEYMDGSGKRGELSRGGGQRSMRHFRLTHGRSERDAAVAVVDSMQVCTDECVNCEKGEVGEDGHTMRLKELMDEMRVQRALGWWHGQREKHELQH